MNQQQLTKAHNFINKLKKLDDEIASINQAAQVLAGGNNEVAFSVSVKNLQPDASKKPVLDSDGNLINHDAPKYTFFVYPNTGAIQKEKEPNTILITQQLCDTDALQLLGIILQYKQQRREKLIYKLKKLGVN